MNSHSLIYVMSFHNRILFQTAATMHEPDVLNLSDALPWTVWIASSGFPVGSLLSRLHVASEAACSLISIYSWIESWAQSLSHLIFCLPYCQHIHKRHECRCQVLRHVSLSRCILQTEHCTQSQLVTFCNFVKATIWLSISSLASKEVVLQLLRLVFTPERTKST